MPIQAQLDNMTDDHQDQILAIMKGHFPNAEDADLTNAITEAKSLAPHLAVGYSADISGASAAAAGQVPAAGAGQPCQICLDAAAGLRDAGIAQADGLSIFIKYFVIAGIEIAYFFASMECKKLPGGC